MSALEKGERKVSLIDIGRGMEDLEELIEQAMDEGREVDAAELFELLEATEGQFADKVARGLMFIAGCEARIDGRKKLKAGLDVLQKRDEKKIAGFRGYLSYALQRFGFDKLQTALGTVSLAKPKRRLVEVDAYAAALAGFGEVEVVAKTTSLDGIRELGALMMNLAASGTPVTVTATVRLAPDDAERIKDTLTCSTVCSSRPVADEAAILAAAERDAAALAEHEQQVVAALAAGTEPPGRPEPTLPAGVARTEMVRTLSIRRG